MKSICLRKPQIPTKHLLSPSANHRSIVQAQESKALCSSSIGKSRMPFLDLKSKGSFKKKKMRLHHNKMSNNRRIFSESPSNTPVGLIIQSRPLSFCSFVKEDTEFYNN
ncbi:unnamed protein product [Moneuplotes crassus]|uniref:Uncharacterized protein n=1 Tax=Euplotes crassus TaxID=5936 RepID=A0AAD1XE71_EUPCR|nr:unnamed protein product [Moneuplotes crassus]